MIGKDDETWDGTLAQTSSPGQSVTPLSIDLSISATPSRFSESPTSANAVAELLDDCEPIVAFHQEGVGYLVPHANHVTLGLTTDLLVLDERQVEAAEAASIAALAEKRNRRLPVAVTRLLRDRIVRISENVLRAHRLPVSG